MGIKTSFDTVRDTITIDDYIDTSYDIVKEVYDNMSSLIDAADSLRFGLAGIADLPAVPGYDQRIMAVSSYYGGIPDDGGGIFEWDESGDAADHDGISIFDPNHSITPGATGYWTAETGTGVWRRVMRGAFVNPKMAGVKGDGTTDDTEAFIAAINYCLNTAPYKSLITPEGVYYVTDSLVTTARSQPDFQFLGTGRSCIFKFMPASQTTPLFDITGVEKLVFKNFSAIGNYSNPADIFHVGNQTNYNIFKDLWLYPVPSTTDGSNPVHGWKIVNSGNFIINRFENITIWDQAQDARNGAVTQSGSGLGVIGVGMDETISSNCSINDNTFINFNGEGIQALYKVPKLSGITVDNQNLRIDGVLLQGLNGSGDSAILENSTSTTISGAVLTDTTKTWAVDEYKGRYLQIDSGSYQGQIRRILSNTATALTCDFDFDDTTNADYVIFLSPSIVVGRGINVKIEGIYAEHGTVETINRVCCFYGQDIQHSRFDGFCDSLIGFSGSSETTVGNHIRGQFEGVYINGLAARNTIQDLKYNFGVGVSLGGLFDYSSNTRKISVLNGTSGIYEVDQYYPKHAYVSAVLSSNTNNVTGDGTDYTIVYDTELDDSDTAFDGTTYTAPLNGWYMVVLTVRLSSVTSSHTQIVPKITTSNRAYQLNQQQSAAPFPEEPSYNFTQLVDMEVSDTLTTQIKVGGSTKTVDLIGAAVSNVYTSLMIKYIGG